MRPAMLVTLCSAMLAFASDKTPEIAVLDSKGIMGRSRPATSVPDEATIFESYGAFAGGAGMSAYVDQQTGLVLFSTSDPKDSRHMLRLVADAKAKLAESMPAPEVGRSEAQGQALMVFHFSNR